MNYQEYVTECSAIRTNNLIRDEMYKKLKELERNKYTGLAPVSDPSRDYLQRTKSNDSKVINKLTEFNEKRETLYRILDNIPPADEAILKSIYHAYRVEAEIVRLYVIEALPMKVIAKRFNYNPTYCYQKYKSGLKVTYKNYIEEVSKNA